MVIDWAGSVTPIAYAFWGAALLVGVVGHELCHFFGFTVFGRVPKVRIAPKYLGLAFEPRETLPRWQVALISMAPIAWAGAGAVAFYHQFDFPIDWRVAVTLGLFFVGALPSPGDIYTALLYHPDAAGAEVVADG